MSPERVRLRLATGETTQPRRFVAGLGLGLAGATVQVVSASQALDGAGLFFDYGDEVAGLLGFMWLLWALYAIGLALTIVALLLSMLFGRIDVRTGGLVVMVLSALNFMTGLAGVVLVVVGGILIHRSVSRARVPTPG